MLEQRRDPGLRCPGVCRTRDAPLARARRRQWTDLVCCFVTGWLEMSAAKPISPEAARALRRARRLLTETDQGDGIFSRTEQPLRINPAMRSFEPLNFNFRSAHSYFFSQLADVRKPQSSTLRELREKFQHEMWEGPASLAKVLRLKEDESSSSDDDLFLKSTLRPG